MREQVDGRWCNRGGAWVLLPRAAGSGACTACLSGQYEDSGTCKTCPSGKFQPKTFSTTCTGCAAGYTSAAGSTSPTACTACPSGKYEDSGTCNTCPTATTSGVVKVILSIRVALANHANVAFSNTSLHCAQLVGNLKCSTPA